MLYYGRIHISEGIGINKASVSKERDIYHYSNFLVKGLSFNRMLTMMY